MNRFLLSAILCLPTLLLVSNASYAQQFVAVKVEAENYSSKHPDWRLFSNSSNPNINPDPDGSHAGSASGRAYMELLPDTRVTHSDPLNSSNFWNVGGAGPSMSYNVNIPEAGRYIVFAKAFSTGTEDNGIHVGLNNTNPESGQRMQWCTGKNKWTWSSAQRTASNHCGVARAIYLDFSFAGANTVTFSAREDGFELDQFILLKTNNNSCKPNDRDQIVCNNGTSNVAAQTPTVTPAPAPAPAPAPVAVTAPEPIQEPAPVVEPTPEPVVTAPVATPVQPTAEPAATSIVAPTFPSCTSAASDPDGDGYGWENNQSCVVSASEATSTPAATNAGGFPICQSSGSDPDGDGYGWENNQSCVVDGVSTASASTGTASTSSGFPICNSSASDSDGDGWGWENAQSCIVR